MKGAGAEIAGEVGGRGGAEIDRRWARGYKKGDSRMNYHLCCYK